MNLLGNYFSIKIKTGVMFIMTICFHTPHKRLLLLHFDDHMMNIFLRRRQCENLENGN